MILDKAGSKGTGKWTAINALDLGMPVTLIGEAVFARCLSSIKDERGRASKALSGPKPEFKGDRAAFLKNLEQGLYASKIISYAQGFMLMQTVSGPTKQDDCLLNFLCRLPSNTAGNSTSLPSRSCGVVVVSSDRSS